MNEFQTDRNRPEVRCPSNENSPGPGRRRLRSAGHGLPDRDLDCVKSDAVVQRGTIHSTKILHRRSWRKSLARSFERIAAMGGTAKAALVKIGVRGIEPSRMSQELYRGMNQRLRNRRWRPPPHPPAIGEEKPRQSGRHPNSDLDDRMLPKGRLFIRAGKRFPGCDFCDRENGLAR